MTVEMEPLWAKIKAPPDKATLPNPVAFGAQIHAVRLMHPDSTRNHILWRQTPV